MSTIQDVLLISENTIKESLSLDDNLSYGYIGPAIQVAQDIRLQRILGKSLYDSIRQTILDDPDLSATGNEAVKTLLDNYIKNCLLYEVASQIVIPLSFKTRNLGVIQNNDLNSVIPSTSDIQYLKDYYTDIAQFYEERLIEYLCENASDYPDYKSVLYGINPDDNAYTCAIVL